MNYRWLFILSIVVTAVGFVGIFMQLQQTNEVSQDAESVILTAEASKDLKLNDLLTEQDYTLKYIKTPDANNDKRDISKINNGVIAGYRLREHVAKGAHFTMAVLEQPVSHIVAGHHQLPSGVIYHFPISKKDEYLLTSVNNGDTLSLYIRLTEVRSANQITLNSGENESDGVNENKDHVLYRLYEHIPVINIERSFLEGKAKITDDEPLGTVALKLTTAQLAEIKVLESMGEILLLPNDEKQLVSSRVSIKKVLPQFSNVKELRG